MSLMSCDTSVRILWRLASCTFRYVDTSVFINLVGSDEEEREGGERGREGGEGRGGEGRGGEERRGERGEGREGRV